jgi:hypothetical protein
VVAGQEGRQGWAILPRTSIEACTHTCNIFRERNPDAARCLFEVSVQGVFVLVPVEGEPVMSSYLGSCSLEERGVFLGRQVQSRQLLGLMSLILQVGLVRNGSGNDHIVVRDENAGSAGWPWDRTRAEHGGWWIVRMDEARLGPEAWGWG